MRVQELTKQYDGKTVVDGVSFAIPKGKVISLIGPNGAGKSTVMGMISRQMCIRDRAQVVSFGGKEEAEMLRLAACLEEHFPHSMANAVVEEAKRRGLRHEEYHSKVEYLVAHGIASTVDEERVLIGSAHFVFEDRKQQSDEHLYR